MKSVLALTLLLLAPAPKAKPKAAAPAPATPAKLEVVQINDRRSSGHFASLNVHVKLAGVHGSEVAADRVIATKAVDDTGKDLAAEAQKNDKLTPSASSMGIGRKGDEKEEPGLPLTVMLTSPARGATSIKELSGEIELYVPSKDPQARVTVEKFLSKLGKPLAAPGLTANRVEITLLSKAQLDAEKKKMSFPPEEGEIVARVKDPENRIQDFWFVNPAGEPQRVVDMDRDGLSVLSSWSAKPQADWALRVDLKSPKALVRHTFTLTDLPLP